MTHEILSVLNSAHKENGRYFEIKLLTAQIFECKINLHSILSEQKREEVNRLAVQVKIAEYLHENGIKKKFVAEKAGIKNYRFSHIIHNQTEMKVDEFERICRALGVTPEKFMDFNPDE